MSIDHITRKRRISKLVLTSLLHSWEVSALLSAAANVCNIIQLCNVHRDVIQYGETESVRRRYAKIRLMSAKIHSGGAAVTMRANAGAGRGTRRKSGSLATCTVKFKATHGGNGAPIAPRWRCAIRSNIWKFCEPGGAVRGAGLSCGNEFSVQHTLHDAALVYRTSPRAVLSRSTRSRLLS